VGDRSQEKFRHALVRQSSVGHLLSYCQLFSDQEARVSDIETNIRLSSTPWRYQQALGDLIAELISREHIDFLRETCVDAVETDNYIFVHGGLCPELSLVDQPLFALHWRRFDKAWKPHVSRKKVVCGHTPQQDLMIHDLGHAVCLDAGAYMAKGALTCMDVMNGQVWQVNDDLQLTQQPVVHYHDDLVP
jgi:hypothetical protein